MLTCDALQKSQKLFEQKNWGSIKFSHFFPKDVGTKESMWNKNQWSSVYGPVLIYFPKSSDIFIKTTQTNFSIAGKLFLTYCTLPLRRPSFRIFLIEYASEKKLFIIFQPNYSACDTKILVGTNNSKTFQHALIS